MHRWIALGGLSLWCLACVDDECTLADCTDLSVVSLPPGLVAGPYDLAITGTAAPLHARCSQPAAPEAAENSPELRCDASTFEITAPAGTSVREIQVTIVDVDTGETLADAVTVALDAVGEDTPNGPDCPPVCFIRNGALVVAGGV